MANQPQSLTLAPPRTYTRTDFTALRAFVQRVPAATIARLYYDPELAPQAASADAMERYLRTMRDALVQLALRHGSPVLAEHLKASVRQPGSPAAGGAHRAAARAGAGCVAAPPGKSPRRAGGRRCRHAGTGTRPLIGGIPTVPQSDYHFGII
ncbi:hypothetical protein [Paraburkholderia sp.]|uniref:hypothetical protein n=1 Tax=Paraburkholderia sp. TaxID=1926495 RepID=UPI002D4AF36A|nr:hypothetical protein [Paraburkholderia sp.]HZZ04098.1 hypothetical protein [Paraburkholderia sp.]